MCGNNEWGNVLLIFTVIVFFRILELLSAEDTNILIGCLIVLSRSLHVYQFHHYQTNKLQVSREGRVTYAVLVLCHISSISRNPLTYCPNIEILCNIFLFFKGDLVTSLWRKGKKNCNYG